MNLELPSPAKINLFLDIIGVRDDGYHRLTMVNAKVSLHDTIACSVSESPGIVLTSSGSRIPLDQSNTAYKAAMRFQEQFNRPLGVRIHIEKRIPQGAGLGGGSSNAATVLTAFNRLTGDRESLESLRRIGARIGADVPFFLYEGCCLCEGIGEQVAPLLVPKSTEEPPIHVVLCHPLEHVSTPRAYQQWDLFEQP
nr:4-(cytidine 5'-diphospho)-2-C-methyl-D-erythritol kinase [bacterium]